MIEVVAFGSVGRASVVAAKLAAIASNPNNLVILKIGAVYCGFGKSSEAVLQL